MEHDDKLPAPPELTGPDVKRLLERLSSLEATVADLSKRLEATGVAPTPPAPAPVAVPVEAPRTVPPPIPAAALLASVASAVPPAPVTATAVPFPPPPANPASLDRWKADYRAAPAPAPPTAPPAAVPHWTKLSAGATPPSAPPSTAPAPPVDFEMRIVRVWFPRIGIAALVVGFVYLAQLVSRGPWPKIAGGYAAAIALTALGLWNDRRRPQWARPVLAGGLALSYFISFAACFIAPMRVVQGPVAAHALLAANLAAVFAVAQWKRSEAVAGMALVLGFLSTGLASSDTAALGSVVLLSATAMAFLLVNRWAVSTAGSVAAAYGAHLYAYAFLPSAAGVSGATRAPADIFQHHATYLTAYFAMFAAGAALAGWRPAAIAPPEPVGDVPEEVAAKVDRENHESPKSLTVADAALAAAVQMNGALYLAGMVFALRATGVHWPVAHWFLLPFGLVCAALIFAHPKSPAAKGAYRLLSAAALSLGLMSAAGPAWLPVMLAGASLAMLAAAAREGSRAWLAASLIVMADCLVQVMTDGDIGLHRLFLDKVQVYWWTVMAVTGAALFHTAVAERLSAAGGWLGTAPRTDFYGSAPKSLGRGLGHGLAALAAWAYLTGMGAQLRGGPDWQPAMYWAGPLVAAVAVVASAGPLLAFANTTGLVVVPMVGIFALVSPERPLPSAMVGMALLAFGAARALERFGIDGIGRRVATAGRPRWSTGFQDFTAQVALAALVLRGVQGPPRLPSLMALACAGVAVAAAFGSRSVLRAAALPAALGIAGWIFVRAGVGDTPWLMVLSATLTLAAAMVFGSPAIDRRTSPQPYRETSSPGTATSRGHGWEVTQFALALAASAMATHAGKLAFGGVAGFGVAAAFGAGLVALAGVSARPLLVTAGLITLGVGAFGAVFGGAAYGQPQATGWMAFVPPLGAAAMMVVAERLLRFRARLRLGEGPPLALAPDSEASLKAVLAVAGLATALTGLLVRSTFAVKGAVVGNPAEDTLLTINGASAWSYFSASALAVGFVWTVLGIAFGENVYRKAGFAALLAVLAKALLIDLWSLRIEYRIILLMTMGAALLGAAFLYSRYRDRIAGGPPTDGAAGGALPLDVPPADSAPGGGGGGT